MKRISLTIIFAAVWLLMQAQIYNPVHWTFQADTTAKDVVVRLTASIDDGWHLYDINTPDDGPSATRLEFEELGGVRLDEPPHVKGKPITIFDEDFDMDITYYEHSMTIEQRLPRNGEKIDFKGYVAYNVCNDGNSCLSNNRYDFSFNENPVSAAPVDDGEGAFHTIDFGAPAADTSEFWKPAEIPEGGDVPQKRFEPVVDFLNGTARRSCRTVHPVRVASDSDDHQFLHAPWRKWSRTTRRMALRTCHSAHLRRARPAYHGHLRRIGAQQPRHQRFLQLVVLCAAHSIRRVVLRSL